MGATLTFAELMQDVTAIRAQDRPSYRAKMMHPIGDYPVVERNQMICDLVREKVILDVGASGQLHQDLRAVCPRVFGLDLHPDSEDVDVCDFDDPSGVIPHHPEVEAIVCGEILEHLSNPGFLLARLHATYPSKPLIVSVPNAFSRAAAHHVARGYENVNKDHVAWYSPKTIEWLLARYGYTIKHWAWYNGPPYTAEGILAVAE